MRRLAPLTQATGAVNAGSGAVQPQVGIRPNAGIGRRRPTRVSQAASLGTWRLTGAGWPSSTSRWCSAGHRIWRCGSWRSDCAVNSGAGAPGSWPTGMSCTSRQRKYANGSPSSRVRSCGPVSTVASGALVRGLDRLAFGTAGSTGLIGESPGRPGCPPGAALRGPTGACECPVPPVAVDRPAEERLVFVGSFQPRGGIRQLMDVWNALHSGGRAHFPLAPHRHRPLLDEVSAWAATQDEVTLTVNPPRPTIRAALGGAPPC